MWTVPSPHLPSPPLPSPSLHSPPRPSPPLTPLPSPPLPSPPSPPLPSLPPSLPPACQIWSSWVQPFGRSARVWRRPGDQRVDTLIKLGPAVWPKRASVAPPWQSASENEGSQPWSCECTAKQVFFEVELRELWFESGLMNGPVHDLKGKWSECHRVRNAKRPREGSNSRTVPYYYIDEKMRRQINREVAPLLADIFRRVLLCELLSCVRLCRLFAVDLCSVSGNASQAELFGKSTQYLQLGQRM